METERTTRRTKSTGRLAGLIWILGFGAAAAFVLDVFATTPPPPLAEPMIITMDGSLVLPPVPENDESRTADSLDARNDSAPSGEELSE
ncbi:MAG: hypothetical protein QGF59_03205 [Pirellulaceae bacterium]|nr:hypothetical protein [Pirellulaceae bacterium]